MKYKKVSSMYKQLIQPVGLLMGMLAMLPALGSEVITVETTQHQGQVILGGSVVPYKEVTLTAQVPGTIKYVAGDVGDSFDAGDVLVAIDDEELLAKRRAAVAALSNAEAMLRNSQVQYSRELWSPQSENINRMPGMGVPGLFDQMFTKNAGDMMGYGNPDLERSADLYSRQTGVSQAVSAVQQARSQIDELDAAILDARSVAPFDGVIMKKMVEVGDTLQPGQPLVTFAHVKYLRIQSEVPARLVTNLKVGMVVPAYLDVGREQVEARVAQIYPLADMQHHTVTVKFDLPVGVSGGPGMYAEVMVPDGSESVQPLIIIPNSAVIKGGSLPRVLAVTDNGESVLRVVRLGSPYGENKVIVLSGLKQGERIIDNPPAGASSGWMPHQR
jgi:multidrug efflux pump subunit AcrA (membrane-fusion protein)